MLQRKNKILFFIVVCFACCGIQLHAQFDVFRPDGMKQHVLFEQDVDTSGKIPRYGPNRFFFAHQLLQEGLIPGPQQYGLQTNWWFSPSLAYGCRMKFKLCKWDAFTVDLNYRFDNFSIRQNTPKLSPLTSGRHQHERISLSNFSGALCDRINFGRRGNVLGFFLDLGVYGDWAFHTANVYVDRHYDSNSASGYAYKSKTKLTRLPYISKYNYGLAMHLGLDRAGIFVQWRMNELVKDTPVYNAPDIPRLTVGVEIYTWE